MRPSNHQWWWQCTGPCAGPCTCAGAGACNVSTVVAAAATVSAAPYRVPTTTRISAASSCHAHIVSFSGLSPPRCAFCRRRCTISSSWPSAIEAPPTEVSIATAISFVPSDSAMSEFTG